VAFIMSSQVGDQILVRAHDDSCGKALVKRPVSLPVSLCCATLLGLIPATASASVRPATLALRWGVTEATSVRQPEYSTVPAVTSTWPVGRNVSLWSSASYFWQEWGPPGIAFDFDGGSFRSDHYSRYLPLTIGIRVHTHDTEGRQRGPFLEFGPSLTPAWFRNEAGDPDFALMGGLQTGAGFRIPNAWGTRAELGLSYYLAESFGETAERVSRIGTPHEVDVSAFVAFVALGIGD